MEAEVRISLGVDATAAVAKLGGFAKDLEDATNKSIALQKSLEAVGIKDMGGLSPQIAAQIENTNRSMIDLAQAAGLTKDQIQSLNNQFGGAIGNAAAASVIDRARTQLMGMGVAAGLSASDLQKMGASIGMTAKETEAHTIKVSSSFAKMAEASGMSAAQLSNVTRMLPMQFTDVVTSLASGMPAYMVAIQQGGQIKDMYGSVGLAARAMGEYILGLVNPFTLAAGAVGVLTLAYNQGSKEVDGYRLALVNTGNAAGVTTGQMAGMAKYVGESVGTTGAAAAALTALAATGRVAGEDMEKFATAALWAQKGLGVGVEETAKRFEELGKSPAEASAKLNESLNYLTASTYRQIRAAEEAGDKEGAAAIAQRAYADAIEERGKRMVASMGWIERAAMAAAGGAKSMWDAILNIGREEDPTAKAAAAAVKLLDLRAKLQSGNYGATGNEQYDRAVIESEIADQEKLVSGIQKKTAADNAAAKSQAENAELERKRIEWDKKVEGFLPPEARAIKEARKIKEEGLAVGASQKEIDMGVAAALKSLTDKAQQSANERLKIEVDYYKQLTEEIKSGEKLMQSALSAERSAGLIGEVDYFNRRKTLSDNALIDQQASIELEIEEIKRSGIAQKDKVSQIAALNNQIAGLERERVAIAQQAEIDIAAARRKEIQALATESIDIQSAALESWHKLALVKDADYYQNSAKNNEDYWNARVELAFASYENETRYALEGSQVEITARQKLDKVLRDGVTERELASKNALATAYEYGRAVDLSLQRQAYEVSLVLQTGEERTKLLAIYDIEAQKLEKIRQVMATTPEGEARDKAVGDIEAAAARAKQGEVSKALNSEWKTHLDFAEGVARGIWDDYTSGAGNAAQNALAKLKKELFDEIYKLALKPLVLDVIANVTGQAGAMSAFAGAGGGGAGGGAGGGLLNMATSAMGLPSLGAIGGSLSTGLQAGWSGTSLTSAISAYSAAGETLTATMLGLGEGLGSFAAALGPVGLGVGAVALLAGSGMFGDNNQKAGGTYQYTAGAGIDVWRDEAGRTRLGTGGRVEIGDNLIQASIQKTTDTINKVLEQIGSVSRVKTLVAGAQSSSEKPEAMIEAYGVLDTGKKFGIQGEQKLGRTATPEEVYGALQEELNRAVLDAVKNAAEIPKSVKEMLAKVDPRGIENDKFNEYLTRIIDDAQAAITEQWTGMDVSDFGDLLAGMADESISAAEYMSSGITDSIGEAWAGRIQSQFASAMYSGVIQPIIMTATTTGMSADAIKGQLLEAQSVIASLKSQAAAMKEVMQSDAFKDLMTDIGDAMAGAQEPIRELQSYIPETSKSAKKHADDISNASKDIADAAKKEADAAKKEADERKGLQDKLDALTMTRAQLLEKERNELHESNRALFDQLKAREALDAAQKLSQSELKKQAGLQIDLIEAQGDAVTAREMRRVAAIQEATAGMNEYNAELVAGSMIATGALEDQVAAARELQSITDSLGDKYSSLQVDFLTAAGDEAGAKALKRQQELDNLLLNKSDADAAEITNLYNRNAAIEDQIDLANKAKKADEERKGLQDRLDALTMTRAQLLEKERNAVSESNRALFDKLKAQEEFDAAQKLSQSELKKQESLRADLIEAQGDAVTAQEMRRAAAIKEATEGMSEYNAKLVAGAMNATSALEDMLQATKTWESVSESLRDEVKKLRGELFGNTEQGLAAAQAELAIAQAQAKAGDQKAAEKLPELSSRVVEIARNMGMAGADLRQIVGETAMSLESVSIAAKERADALLKQANEPIAPMPMPTVAPVLTATNKAATTDLSLALTGLEKKLDDVINQSITNNNQLATVVRQSAALPVTVAGVVRTV